MTPLRRPAVLVVEDESVLAVAIQESLRSLGHDAYAIASSAQEALARAAERRPDIVLMDIRIQGPLDGIETAQLLRSRYDVPVIYLTADSDAGTIARVEATDRTDS